MFAFMIIALLLSYWVKTESSILIILTSDLFNQLCLGINCIVIISVFFKKLAEQYAYDAFASSLLLFWYGYWQSFFVDTLPLYYVFPLYFVFVTVFMSLFLINQRHRIDIQSFKMMRSYEQEFICKPWLVMVCTLGSLEMIEHFLFFPVMMTLVILRYTLFACLQPA